MPGIAVAEKIRYC